jgi:hypothetical protein
MVSRHPFPDASAPLQGSEVLRTPKWALQIAELGPAVEASPSLALAAVYEPSPAEELQTPPGIATAERQGWPALFSQQTGPTSLSSERV